MTERRTYSEEEILIGVRMARSMACLITRDFFYAESVCEKLLEHGTHFHTTNYLSQFVVWCPLSCPHMESDDGEN